MSDKHCINCGFNLSNIMVKNDKKKEEKQVQEEDKIDQIVKKVASRGRKKKVDVEENIEEQELPKEKPKRVYKPKAKKQEEEVKIEQDNNEDDEFKPLF